MLFRRINRADAVRVEAGEAESQPNILNTLGGCRGQALPSTGQGKSEMADPGCPVGLFDFRGYSDVVTALSHVLSIPSDEVHERLFQESMQGGWNSNRAVRQFHVTPHTYSGRMAALYQESDAFVFELVVVHLRPYSQEIDQRVARAVWAQFPGQKNLRILAFGDGIGTDALRFAATGHDVAYFDPGGYPSALARFRFRRMNLEHRIRVYNKYEEIPNETFDVLICREVLEHVPDPPALVRNLRRYLRNSGIAVITESFGAVEPCFPTHLAENRKYQGNTARMFVQVGFGLLCSFPDQRPMVFQKTDVSDRSRFRSIQDYRTYPVREFVRRAGRELLQLLPF
jgi:2-polyprenyl-3-methyl-5-hydroxy-6-metoxy-1,4-benzoquinol methylase